MYVHNLIALSGDLYTFVTTLYCVCLYPHLYQFQEAAVVVWADIYHVAPYKCNNTVTVSTQYDINKFFWKNGLQNE